MNRKKIIYCISAFVLLVTSISLICFFNKDNTLKTSKINAKILKVNNDKITLKDKDNIIYTFNLEDVNLAVGENVSIEYTGLLNKNQELQDIEVINYEVKDVVKDENGIPRDWLDDGIFGDFYLVANTKLNKLSLDEKIGQLFLVRYNGSNAINDLIKYNFGGYVFYENDFKDKTEIQVKDMINSLQRVSNIPLFTAVDEEGGKVVRISSNPNLVSEKFKAASELYNLGGFDLIKEDTIKKSKILFNLGINLNLAPVIDVSTNPNDYMHERTLKQNTDLTSEYAKTVIEASKGLGVSYTLKHFPGYGNNIDTHLGVSIDNRSYEYILNNDIPPFKEGINAGAEAVLISHSTVNSIDSNNPASLSSSIHNLLRNEAKFTGISITDDLSMGALSTIDNAAVKAILAGNDLIISTDYKKDINSVKDAVKAGTIDEATIDKLTFRILAWKYYKGLITDEK